MRDASERSPALRRFDPARSRSAGGCRQWNERSKVRGRLGIYFYLVCWFVCLFFIDVGWSVVGAVLCYGLWFLVRWVVCSMGLGFWLVVRFRA